MTADAIDQTPAGGTRMCLAFFLANACFTLAHAGAALEPEHGAPPRIHAAHHIAPSTLEGRISLLSKALDLDVKQQAELRKILQRQREEVRKVWDDTSMAAPYRISATQAIGEETAGRIRGLLNDEQKKKYKPPQAPHQTTAGAGSSVEEWMNRTPQK